MSMNATQRRVHRAATSDAMRRRAERTQCVACKRKNATKRVSFGIGCGGAIICRYCKHERAIGTITTEPEGREDE
jgi:hypothetical protein